MAVNTAPARAWGDIQNIGVGMAVPPKCLGLTDHVIDHDAMIRAVEVLAVVERAQGVVDLL